jgi:hypothetical protein
MGSGQDIRVSKLAASASGIKASVGMGAGYISGHDPTYIME